MVPQYGPAGVPAVLAVFVTISMSGVDFVSPLSQEQEHEEQE